MSVLAQFVVVAKTLVKHGVALALRHIFELAGLEIAQTDVFHWSSVRDRATHRVMQLLVASKVRLRGLAGGKCSPKGNYPRFRESLRHCGVGDEHIEAVIRAWNYM